MKRPSLVIVTPALADANNGNWQTAHRWAGLLATTHRVMLTDRWQAGGQDLMIALHARRSAPSMAAWREAHPQRPLLLVLTGTDLYRDIATDASAQRSLELADRLIVLHERAVGDLPERHRAKAVALFQSTTPRRTVVKSRRRLRALMVGHLREEKAPETYFAAARLLAGRDDILLDHIGAALDPAIGAEARALQQACPHYRWLGAQPHAATRARIQRAHVLVHTSRIEGGAHVVMEAICSGTPVLATRIAGNVGLLGPGYAGYIEPGDGEGLAALLERCRDTPAILDALREQCAARAPLFEPARERMRLTTLLHDLLERPR